MMNQQLISILLVEDNPGDAFFLQQLLKESQVSNFQVSHFDYLAKAISHLENATCDVILLDLLLPDSQGLKTLLNIQQKAPNIPIVILTGMNDQKLAMEAVRKGAQDYLIKGQVTTELLTQSIRYAIERKIIQKELKKRTEQLEKTNQELKKRTEELEAVNQELKAFSYTVSHDLRNPITSLKGVLFLWKEKYKDKFDTQDKQWLDMMNKGCNQMNQLIQDLMLFSHVEKQNAYLSQVNLSVLANRILQQLEMKYPNKKVEAIVGSNIIAMADENLVYIALENLLNNAVKYSQRQEKVRVEVGSFFSSESQELENNQGEEISQKQLVYFVADHGVGFDMKNADKLFIPFERLHSKYQFEGTGIGLATVQRIIKRHGGKIWANSEVGKGATFYFTIPSSSQTTEQGIGNRE
ncbi:MAG: response regulator [Okeania sp. SIO3I5]|uniref:ATP-binding protein n=1 Tax=Okeania sp. SIO3I5 TaxID=2607805 RepID=UPI0013B75ECA|nr:ATP-binding protein [Okeania sp. SIO3I5]NEQ36480.1 response regulator [Okeania sp. SIO3I5]